jgi:hypothetical protein
MNIPGITWQGESIEDVEILPELPTDLVRLLSERNGFILHEGALHVRGACLAPDWHSLRSVWRGEKAFFVLYEKVSSSDIPFAQDQFGDQFLLREAAVFRLFAESGEIEKIADSLQEFLDRCVNDVEKFLNVGLHHKMKPGQLLHAFPPFMFEESGRNVSLKPLPASEVILFHADLARQIQDVPDGGKVEFRVVD